jgi:hypothetical protein
MGTESWTIYAAYGIGRCAAHGKALFPDRRSARQARRAAWHGERMAAYRCDAHAGYWHLGHLPSDVRQGVCTRDEAYPEGS